MSAPKHYRTRDSSSRRIAYERGWNPDFLTAEQARTISDEKRRLDSLAKLVRVARDGTWQGINILDILKGKRR